MIKRLFLPAIVLVCAFCAANAQNDDAWGFHFPHKARGAMPDTTLLIRAFEASPYKPLDLRKDINVYVAYDIRVGFAEHLYGMEFIDLPNLYYSVIEYPGKGWYYGFVQTPGGETSWEHMEPMAGRFVTTQGDTIPVIGNLDACLSPKPISGTYRNHVRDDASMYDYYTKLSEGYITDRKYTGVYTFNAGGTGSLSYGREFTDDTPQVSGGDETIALKNRHGGHGGFKNVTVLTGGWPFDVDAKATMQMRWSVKDGVLNVHTTSKPTYSVTTKLNTDDLINQWKEEDAMYERDFVMDTYRRQYIAQCKADYPNYMITNIKKTLTDDLKEVCHLPQDESYRIVGVSSNDIYTLPYGSDDLMKLVQFQKKKGATTLIDLEDLQLCMTRYKNHIWRSLMDRLATEREKQLMGIDETKYGKVVSLFARFDDNNLDKIRVLLLAQTAGRDRLVCYFTRAAFLPDGKLDMAAFSDRLVENKELEEAETKIAENDVILNAYATDAQFIAAKSTAADFLDKHGKQPRKFRYSTVEEYVNAVSQAENFIKLQEEAIKLCRQDM